MGTGIKLYFLSLGRITCDTNALVALMTRATSLDPHPLCRFEPFPVWAAYIETPGAKLLWDTGLRADCFTGGEPESTKINIPISRDDNESLEHQLSLCGVSPEEIDCVIMSHLHHDHAGRINLFKNAKIVVQRREMERARAETQINPMGTYLKADIDIDANWKLIDGDLNLLPGVKLLSAPGHAEGLQCLQLELDNLGTALLTSDACYTSINWGPPMRPPGVLDDSRSYFSSLRRLHAIAEKTNATVFFGHDMAQFDTLRKAPEFYD